MNTLVVGTRIQLRNILFLTDFSTAADSAVPYVTELAKRYGAKIHALHVRPLVINPMTPPGSWTGLEEAAEIAAEQRRRELLETFAGVPAEVLIKEGDLLSVVDATIEGCKIDLIVMGTRGRSGISKFMLGSVAEEILRHASCPVLSVGPHAPARQKRGGEFTRILFATDCFSSESAAAAPYAISLAQECQAYLTLVHVIEEPKAGELVRPSELVTSCERLLRDLVPLEAELRCVPEYVIEHGGTAEKILEVAAKREADLIVLGVRQSKGFPGAATHLPITIAHKVVSRAGCPVLTVLAARSIE